MQQINGFERISRQGVSYGFIAAHILLVMCQTSFSNEELLQGVRILKNAITDIGSVYVEYTTAWSPPPPPEWASKDRSTSSAKLVSKNRLWISKGKSRLESETGIVSNNAPFRPQQKEVTLDSGGERLSLRESIGSAERLEGWRKKSPFSSSDSPRILYMEILGPCYLDANLLDPFLTTNSMRNGKYYIHSINEAGDETFITVAPEMGGFATHIKYVMAKGLVEPTLDAIIIDIRLKQWGSDRRWFPVQRRKYVVSNGKKRLEEETTVTKVEFVSEFPPETFTLNFPPGTEVHDVPGNTTYLVE